jgi:hypothetical protein
MKCLGSRSFDYIKDGAHLEVTFTGSSRTNTVSLVSLSNMHGVSISVRVHCNSLNSHLVASFDHTSRYFSSVSDEDLVEGRWVCRATETSLGERSNRLAKDITHH